MYHTKCEIANLNACRHKFKGSQNFWDAPIDKIAASKFTNVIKVWQSTRADKAYINKFDWYSVSVIIMN